METTSKNIVLVGPMGSGKTTVGRRLAHELNKIGKHRSELHPDDIFYAVKHLHQRC